MKNPNLLSPVSYGPPFESAVAGSKKSAYISPTAENEKHGGAAGQGMTDELIKALAMLDAFESVGVKSFDVTITDLDGSKLSKGGFFSRRTLEQLRHSLPMLLRETTAHRHNLIIRPVAHDGNELVQLDDLSREQARKFQDYAFLTLCTSPENYQAWVAVSDPEGDFARRLKKGAGADPSASGATRISGSRNFKPKYGPDFPMVEIDYVNPGLKVTRSELMSAGVVAPRVQRQVEVKSEPAQLNTLPGLVRSPHLKARVNRIHASQPRPWPNYQTCVNNAPKVHGGDDRPDISKADFTWCMIAIDWGHSIQETAIKLMERSAKAHENGERYAHKTATNAALAVARNRSEAPDR